MDQKVNESKRPTRTKPVPNYPGAVMIGAEELEHAAEVLQAQSPFRYYGPDVQHAVQSFETMMAQQFQVPYVLAVSSGTAALVVALKALGIGYGDKVIVPANTFIATPGAVVAAGAVPVFADVDDSLNLDPNDLDRVMDEDVKAIIAVPILGNPVDLDPVMAFAERHNIAVIEDVAQSCGAKYNGRYVGTQGHIGVYSFQMNKILTAGEGGAVVTRDPKLFERAVRYHDQGIMRDKARYGVESNEQEEAFLGQNYRMSELAGAVLVEQWRKLDMIVSRMQMHCRTMRQALQAAIPAIRFRSSGDLEGDIGSNLGIIMPSAEAVQLLVPGLQAKQIAVHLLYGGRPVYMMPQLLHQRTIDPSGFPFNYPFRNPVNYEADMCPQALDLMARTIYLPMSPILTEQDVEEMIAGFVEVAQTTGAFQ